MCPFERSWAFLFAWASLKPADLLVRLFGFEHQLEDFHHHPTCKPSHPDSATCESFLSVPFYILFLFSLSRNLIYALPFCRFLHLFAFCYYAQVCHCSFLLFCIIELKSLFSLLNAFYTLKKWMQDNGNKIVRQSGLWRTERPAGRVPVRTPSLAPDAPAQTRRRGTLRVSVGLSGSQSQRFQQLSFYTTTFGKDNGFPTISIRFKDLSSARAPLRTPCLFWESFGHLASVLSRSSLQSSLGVNDLLRQVAFFKFKNTFVAR